MNIQNLIISFMQSEFAEGLGWVLLNSLWQFLVIAAIYFGFRAIFQNAQIRYVGGVSLMVLAVSAFVGTSVFVANQSNLRKNDSESSVGKSKENDSLASLGHQHASISLVPNSSANMAEFPVETQTGISNETFGTAKELISEESISAAVPTAGDQSAWSKYVRIALPYIVIAWCVGVTLAAIRPILGIVFMYRVRRNQIDAVSPQLDSRMSRLAAQMGIKNSIRLLQSGMAQVPMVVGYFRPLVILPLSVVTQFTTSEIDAILRHELAHIRRHDVLVNFIQSLIETVFFYHPCVWWVSNQVRIERENCCDDAAATEHGTAINLANALFRLEETRVGSTVVAAAGGDLQSRIKRLVVKKTRMESKFVSMRLPTAIAATLIVFGVSLSAIASNSTSVQPFDDFGTTKTITVQSVGDSFNWKVIDITDAKSVAQILSHFPGFNKTTRGADPAGYEIDLQLSLKNESGAKIVIGLNSTLGLWNRGNGDFLMSKRLDFLKAIQNHPQSRATLNPKPPHENQNQEKTSLVKLKGSDRSVEIEYDDKANTMIFRGPKKAVEKFDALLKKHNEASLQQKLKGDANDSDMKAEHNILIQKLSKAQAILEHSRTLFRKGFITQLQLNSDEHQVKLLQEQVDYLQIRKARKSAQVTEDENNRKKRVAIQQQIQMSRIKLVESELEVAMREYGRLKKLAAQNSIPKSSVVKAKLELDRKQSELTILKLELEQIELNSKSHSATKAADNSVLPKPKTNHDNELELQILDAEINYAKSAFQIALEKRDGLQLLSKQTGRTSQLTNAILEAKRLEADLRILELRYENAKNKKASTEQSNLGRSQSTRSPEIVEIELDYAKNALEMTIGQLDLATELHKSGRSDRLQLMDAKQKQLLAEKNLRILQVELDSLTKSRGTKKTKRPAAPPK